ncbi:hypothetical protein MVEN_00843700 [Mycena venus]|uniref:Uncharacterized protein n=1 Tax=Mycena venus TaxID=2733690 RepID=A0A8H7D0Z4_9AGAR|nr:hypothetical protein MVEN_00843700 [Mycena venus]
MPPLLTDVRFAFGRGLRKEQGPSVLSSPLLRGIQHGRITIAASDLNALVPPTPFTWHHLTNLNLELNGKSFLAMNSQTAYRLLKGCTHLKSLKFPFRSSEIGPLTEGLLVVPSLESLVIIDKSHSFDVFGNLVGHFTIPRLAVFSVEIHTTGTPSDMLFLEHLARHSPLISDLTLDISNFTMASLVSTLPLFSCLAKLSLLLSWDSDDEVATKLLTSLTPNSSAPNPCPALQELFIESRGLTDPIWSKFLQSHLDCRTSLRQLHLQFWCDPPDIIPDVERFLTRGLNVSLMYCPVKKSLKRGRVTPWDGVEL